MVPFATFVNVGPEYGPSFDKNGKQVAGTGADWLDLEGSPTVPQSELGAGASRFQLYANLGQTWPGCVETRYSASKDYDVDDTPPDPAKPETLFVPAFAHRRAGHAGLRQQLHQVRRQAEGQGQRGEEEALGEIWRRDRCGRQSAAGGLLDRWSSRLGNWLGMPTTARRRSRSTPARPRATASPRGPGTAATCSRSRR